MAWTKEQFIAFCQRCGVDHNKALKEGKVRLSFNRTGPTLGTIKSKQVRKKRAIKIVHKIQDSLSEPIESVALGKEVCAQDEGMVSPAARFRVSIIGLRVRPIDPDNFTAGCKGIIDGIVRSRLIPGDDWSTLQIDCSQRKVKTWNDEGTEIVIESLT